jgi:hypothetical protein
MAHTAEGVKRGTARMQGRIGVTFKREKGKVEGLCHI